MPQTEWDETALKFKPMLNALGVEQHVQGEQAPNRNLLWASIVVDELARSGLRAVCIAPGSRSTPLTVAFAQHPGIKVYPHLDERSAAFFALGIALKTDQPVALVCTSGTALAKFFPAVIEAHELQVPLIILTGDRPPELRDSGANQTIDQVKLYGGYALWSVDMALPEADPDPLVIRYLRTTAARAYATANGLRKGVVHSEPPAASKQEIAALMAAARQLRPRLRAARHETLIGLLAVTGCRPGNPGLDRGDVDLDNGVVHVRAGKQNKQRQVPLHHSTVGALRAYAGLRDARFPLPSTPAFFLSARGRRMGREELNATFISLVRQVGLEGTAAPVPAAPTRSQALGGRRGYAPCRVVVPGGGPRRSCSGPHNPGGRGHRPSESSQPIREVSEVQSGRLSGVSGW